MPVIYKNMKQYYFTIDCIKVEGPCTAQELDSYFCNNIITADTQIIVAGTEQWQLYSHPLDFIPPRNAADYIAAKRLLPSELRTAETMAMGAWVHERVFVMASVTDKKTLEANQKIIEEVLRGNFGRGEARNELRKFYKQIGYAPPTGLEGSIHDLSNPERMSATIERYVQEAQGWARMRQCSGNIANPGLELYRAGHANQPRDWDSRWKQHSGACPDASDSVMIALVTSSIWLRISAFARTFPPYDLDSRMDIRPVSLARCIELGLFPDPRSDDPEEAEKGKAELRKIKNQNDRLNDENQEVDYYLSDADLRQILKKNLRGLACLEDGVIRMTEPYNAAEISEESQYFL